MMNKTPKLTLANDAKKKMKDSINFSNKSEIVEINKAESRILSKDIIAKFNIPEEDNSAVDGYALNFKKNNKIFNVVGQSRPSSPYLKLDFRKKTFFARADFQTSPFVDQTSPIC